MRERFFLEQTDTFFRTPRGRLKLREFADGSAELIGYERPDQSGPKHSVYAKTPIPGADSFREAMGLALDVRGTVRKRREVLLVGQTRIHLDEVDELGHFVELEVVLEEGQDTAHGERIAQELLDALAIPQSDLLSCAYIDLIDGDKA